jgi:hypothetical protein
MAAPDFLTRAVPSARMKTLWMVVTALRPGTSGGGAAEVVGDAPVDRPALNGAVKPKIATYRTECCRL